MTCTSSFSKETSEIVHKIHSRREQISWSKRREKRVQPGGTPIHRTQSLVLRVCYKELKFGPKAFCGQSGGIDQICSPTCRIRGGETQLFRRRDHNTRTRGWTATGRPAARRVRAPYLAAAYRAAWLLWPLTPPASKVTTCRDTQGFTPGRTRLSRLVPAARQGQEDPEPCACSRSECIWTDVGAGRGCVTTVRPTVWTPWLWVWLFTLFL